MAIVNKVGKLLMHSAVKHINKEFSVSTPSIFQAIRSMSSAKLFVGGISYSTDDMSLKEAFAQYGEIVDAKVIVDRETGRSRGFGFIVFATSEDASSAMQSMDGQDLHGRRIRVNYATERSRPGFGGSGGGYASSYGGNDNYRAGSYGSGGYGGNDNHRAGSYGSSGYGVRGSYGGGNAGNSYTGGGTSGVYDDSSSRNYGVPDGTVANNYQFNENTGGDLGPVSNELSRNSGFGYDDGQFGSIQNDRIGRDDGQSVEPFEDNCRENNDEPDDYAQTRR